MTTTRRAFLGYSGGTMLTLWLVGSGAVAEAVAQLPGGSLDPGTIPRFAHPLAVPGVMPRAAGTQVDAGRVDRYEVSVRQVRQQVLPAPLPATTVWAYGPADAPLGSALHHAPSLTIEARWRRPVCVRWVNELVDEQGRFLPHLLPVDPTLHWANPERVPDEHGRAWTDIRPSLAGRTYVAPDAYTDPATQYTAYRGPVPMVTHVHGAMAVGDESDGHPEAWCLPAATDADGYAAHGAWYAYHEAAYARKFGETWGPGFTRARYPNENRASTLWYHDHTLGMTRLNVYAGPAGFYLVRGGPGGDDEVRDARTRRRAVLPGPAPRAGSRPGKDYREIPLAIQDRSFNADGSLFYPDTRAFFDGYAGPHVPHTPVPPVWNPEFFGNVLVVNGRAWPYLEVQQRRYRFRLLNGCQSRFLVLDFGRIPGVGVWQIGNDGGLLEQPVDLGTTRAGRLLLAPAERADVIVDFGAVPVGRHVLGNLGPDDPFGGGEPGTDFDVADPDTTGTVLQFRVRPTRGVDPTTPPQHLLLPRRRRLGRADRVRRLALLEHAHEFDEGGDGPVAAHLGTVHGDPSTEWAATRSRMWMEPVTQNPPLGATEVWEFYNATADAHPVHVHEVAFEVVDRQAIEVREDGQPMGQSVRLAPGSVPRPPEPAESAVKDTVVAYPGEVTRIKATFATPGRYVWHCHILEHEDNEMMLPIHVGPIPPDSPDVVREHHGHDMP